MVLILSYYELLRQKIVVLYASFLLNSQLHKKSIFEGKGKILRLESSLKVLKRFSY